MALPFLEALLEGCKTLSQHALATPLIDTDTAWASWEQVASQTPTQLDGETSFGCKLHSILLRRSACFSSTIPKGAQTILKCHSKATFGPATPSAPSFSFAPLRSCCWRWIGAAEHILGQMLT